MKQAAFTTISIARDASEADQMIGRLRSAGLHPVDLPLSPHSTPGSGEVFLPIQVPPEEAEAAKELLTSFARKEGGA